jgi:hypothetical protein
VRTACVTVVLSAPGGDDAPHRSQPAAYWLACAGGPGSRPRSGDLRRRSLANSWRSFESWRTTGSKHTLTLSRAVPRASSNLLASPCHGSPSTRQAPVASMPSDHRCRARSASVYTRLRALEADLTDLAAKGSSADAKMVLSELREILDEADEVLRGLLPLVSSHHPTSISRA